MRSYISKISLAVVAMVFGVLSLTPLSAFADEGEDANSVDATNISISPVSKILQLEPSKVYDDKFVVSNNGGADMPFEVYASPYAYSYSEEDGSYSLGFNKENNYTQITRWITFQDSTGNYVTTTKFTAGPGQSVEVHYRISTPDSIPAGGQYAVLFAHTLSGGTDASGIKTEASPGLVVYGRSTGETVINGELSDLRISNNTVKDGAQKTLINGSAKVKNTGNVDFMAYGKLRVDGIFGNNYYETPDTSTMSRISIIPDSELVVSDVWEETPYFGLFNVTWTVEAAGKVETISSQVLILPVPIIILMILLLTIIIIWIIILVRKRKERRSKFMV